MNQKFDVAALGELLIDFTQSGVSAQGNPLLEAVEQAGVIVSFDPNLRPPLWSDPEEARAQIAWGLGQCEVLKIADNELEFMTGQTDFDRPAANSPQCRGPAGRRSPASAGK